MNKRGFVPMCSTGNNPIEQLDNNLGTDVIKINLPNSNDAILLVWGEVYEHAHTSDSELYTFYCSDKKGEITVDSNKVSTIVGPNSPQNIMKHSIPKSSGGVQIVYARKRGTDKDAWYDYLSDREGYVSDLNIQGNQNMEESLPSYGSIRLNVNGTIIACSPEARSVYVTTREGNSYYYILPTRRDQKDAEIALS